MWSKFRRCVVVAVAGLLLCGAFAGKAAAQDNTDKGKQGFGKHNKHYHKQPPDYKKVAMSRQPKKPAQSGQQNRPAALPRTSPTRMHPPVAPGRILPRPSFPPLINPTRGTGLGMGRG
jgi:hypothetical protein